MTKTMTTAQHLALVEQIGYAPNIAASVRERLIAGDPTARFAVFGTALRKGLVKSPNAKPLSQGKIIDCPCGGTYNDASAAMVRMHAGH